MGHKLLIKALAGPALLATLLLVCQASIAHQNEKHIKNILFVFSWHKDMPWQKELEKGFQHQFGIEGIQPNLFYEYMDAARFPGTAHLRNFREYLKKKYTDVPLDDVVIESEPATRLLNSSPGMFGKAHILSLNPSTISRSAFSPTVVVPVRIDYETSVTNILKFSHAKNIYLVGGTTAATAERILVVSEIISRKDPARKIISLRGLPMGEILSRVERLNRNSIILYLLVFQDGDGRRYIPYEAAREISTRANAPMFSFWTSLLGSGIVGGYMLSGEQVGREAARILMQGSRKEGHFGLSKRFHGFYFDWRQLIRWEINRSKLPSGSTILFKRPEFYKEHFLELAAASVLLILIMFSIRYRELKQHNREINSARQGLESANSELGRVKQSLEEKNEMLRELSITDSLTGLYNRAFLDEKLRDEFNRIERNQDHLSIILVDIDYFKQVNDQYGHQAGDEVLVSIANLFRQNVRTVDSIGRWGGEEFIIICPGSDEHQSFQLAEKLRKIIQQAKHDQVDSVTCSFGVASHEPGMTRPQLIMNADKALYESKKLGRNRVTGASELSANDLR